MQRRPWLKIPLKVMGPLAQPHPSVAKIDPAALTGGMVLTNKLMQLKTGDVLNYFEVHVILCVCVCVCVCMLESVLCVGV